MNKLISLSEVAKTLEKSKSVAIICHVRPDGDTLGSAYALKCVLEKKDIFAKVLCDDAIPEKFDFILEGQQRPLVELNGEFDLMVAIDCADVSRTGAFAQAFLEHKNTLVIDHHISNTRFAKNNYVSPYSANCINVYQIAKEMGVEIDKQIANFLACGIMTDTGRFCHKDVQNIALVITAELMEKGANLNQINRELFAGQSKNRAKLFGFVMSSLRYYCKLSSIICQPFYCTFPRFFIFLYFYYFPFNKKLLYPRNIFSKMRSFVYPFPQNNKSFPRFQVKFPLSCLPCP